MNRPSVLSVPLHRRRQQGASLLIAMMMLVVVMLLGIAASHISLMNEKASRNDRDRQIAFQAAEAALQDADRDLRGMRVAEENFPDAPGVCHPQSGLCLTAGAMAAWQQIDWGAASPSVEYGRFTGRVFPQGRASLPAHAPRYLIELIRMRTDKPPGEFKRYRITALGFGARENTQVMLQTVYAAAGNKTGARLSWRELSNWQEAAHSTP